MTAPVYLVTESDGFFGQRRMPWEGLNLDIVEEHLGKEFKPYRVTWMQLANGEVCPRKAIILHSSSQQPEYKSFIDDVMLYLEGLGNQLIPSIHATRSHENKGYQELHKRLLGISSLESIYFAKIKELEINEINYPLVLKKISGFGSVGVSLVNSTEELISVAVPKGRLPWTDLLIYWKSELKYFIWKYLFRRKKLRPFKDYFSPLERCVLQKFIADLSCDYKVLAFQKRFFVAKRQVKANDFRASGSGNIVWDSPPSGLLDCALETLRKFNEPFMSFDFAYDGSNFHLVEFQGVHFGPLLIYEAPTHFQFINGIWHEFENKISLEAVVGDSIRDYLLLQNTAIP